MHQQCTGRRDFAQHENLALLTRKHADDIAAGEYNRGWINSLLHQLWKIDPIDGSSAIDLDLTLITTAQKTSRTTQCFWQCHRQIVDRLNAWRLDFSFEINTLAAKRLHSQSKLRISQIT